MTPEPPHLLGRQHLASSAPLLGRIGDLETRLARTKSEIRTAQEIRYQVFYEEMGAAANRRTKLQQRDEDRYDKYCDHLIVVDCADGVEKIVGTYRLLQDRQARLCGGFYSQSEFDISNLTNGPKDQRLLELGRSCILREYRSKRTMELMWQGIWAYVLNNEIDVLFGCASFPGTDPQKHTIALSWLGRHMSLPDSKEHRALCDGRIDLQKLPFENDDPRRALAGMPPLLKGYLRVGAKVGCEAVIDHQFSTIDVLVVLQVKDIAARYISHYGKDASRFAA